jgi:hypothetical protein
VAVPSAALFNFERNSPVPISTSVLVLIKLEKSSFPVAFEKGGCDPVGHPPLDYRKEAFGCSDF